MLYQEIFAEIKVDLEILINKLAESEINIEKFTQLLLEFLKYPNNNAN